MHKSKNGRNPDDNPQLTEYPNSKPFLLRGNFKQGDVFHAHVDYYFKGARITYVGEFEATTAPVALDGPRGGFELWAVSRLNHCLPFVIE
jgi:hypothetical protein